MAELFMWFYPRINRNYIIYIDCKLFLYCDLFKDLYGTLGSPRLFWKILTRKLKGWGFIIN